MDAEMDSPSNLMVVEVRGLMRIKNFYARLMSQRSWNIHDVGDGWVESSHSVFLPSGGILEYCANNLGQIHPRRLVPAA